MVMKMEKSATPATQAARRQTGVSNSAPPVEFLSALGGESVCL